MDYKYLESSLNTGTNYNNAQNYNQPATQTTNYSQDERNQNYPSSSQDYPQQDLNQQAVYQEGEVTADSTEPSLSDYNSHESCIRITTKK